MAIAESNILLLQSERMTDASDGGGLPTGTAIVDGQSNNIFPDISELDRTVGRVNLRKVHVAIQTTTQPPETYLGANLIVAERPADANVSAVIFTTGSTSDERAAAVGRLESYLTKGARLPGYLYGTHVAGQKTLLILANTTATPPAEGAVLALTKDPGLSTEAQEFVRLAKVQAQFVTLVAGNETVQKLQLTLTLQDELLRDYTGYDARQQDYSSSDRSEVSATVVADAARYYGIRPLVAAASIGDYSARADSIYEALVPAARSETPIVDATPNGTAVTPVAAGGVLTLTTAVALSPTQSIYVGGSIQPATLTVSIGGTAVLRDSGGKLLDADNAERGAVDYANGVLSIVSGGQTYNGTKSIAYRPSARPVRNATTVAIPVTVESRSATVVTILQPIPAPGTLQVSYRAQGAWYVLTDNGAGVVRGSDSSFGAGQLNYTTGSFALTMGALPDVDTAVLLVYGGRTVDISRAGGAVKAGMRLALGRAVVPGDLSISWPTDKTATDDGEGNLTGDATGTVDYVTGDVWLYPNTTPAAGATITVAAGTASGTSFLVNTAASQTDTNGRRVYETGGAIVPGTLRARIQVDAPVLGNVAAQNGYYVRHVWPHPTYIACTDDGNGAVLVAGSATVAGTVNYTTGQVRIAPTFDVESEILSTFVQTSNPPIFSGFILSQS